jgi:WD40 repeat protein
MSPGMGQEAPDEPSSADEGASSSEQVPSDSPDETIVPAQKREDEGSGGAAQKNSGDTQQGTAVSPSAMPSTAADEAPDEKGDDHEFSERPKSAEELREGLNKLSEQSGSAEKSSGGQARGDADDVVDTTAQDIWTEQSARHREGAQRTETAPMSAVAEAGSSSSGDTELEAWKGLSTPLDWVYGVSWRPEADEIAACGQGGAVYVWDADGEQRHKLASTGEELRSVDFAPDGRVVASGGNDGGVHLWLLPEGSDGEVRHARLSGHDSWINGIAVRSDGKWALSASKDRTARLWNLETGECDAVLQGHGGPVTAVGFTDNHLWTAGRDGLVAQWTMTGDRELQWTGYGEIINLDATDGVVSWGTESGTVHKLEGPERVVELQSHTKAARAVSFDVTTGRLATGGADGRLHIYGEAMADGPEQVLEAGAAVWSLNYHAGRLVAGVESGDLRLFK